MKDVAALRKRLLKVTLAEDDVILYAVKATLWLRWVVLLIAIFLMVYRPSFWYPEHPELAFIQLQLFFVNGVVHYLLLAGRPVTWRWMFVLCFLDVATITANVAVLGDFDSLAFIAYYPALIGFAVIFTSPWLGSVWVTAVAVAYGAISIGTGTGLDLAEGEDKALLARVAAMYVIVIGVTLVLRFERITRQSALARERAAQRERIELSQEIHDSTAQTLFLIRIGIEGALGHARESDPALAERLGATLRLSKSALWEIRRPIDMRYILEGMEFRRILGSHIETFSAVTSLPADFMYSGDEPPLTEDIRSGLFSIAHNALANAFLHAQASRVVVKLAFEPDCVRLSVSDDGIGLPGDYAERGHGFRGMEAQAERMHSKLLVDTRGSGEGTTVVCEVPLNQDVKGFQNFIYQRN